MKLYVDGSALVKLLIREAESADIIELWDAADRVLSVATVAVEGRAAIARRLRGHSATRSRRELAHRVEQFELAQVDDALLEGAARVADHFRLRALDALHLAAAAEMADNSMVLATWDKELSQAAASLGLIVYP